MVVRRKRFLAKSGPNLTALALSAIACVWAMCQAIAESPPPVATASAKTVVTGNVTDETGAAIAGATVEWGRNDQPFKARQRATTDDQGGYAMTLKSRNGRCHFAASAAGFAATFGDARFTPGKHERDFVLPKLPADAPVAAGTVVDLKGKPIEGARVEAFTPVKGFNSSFSTPTGRDYFPGPDRVTTTDKEGRFRIDSSPEEEVQLSLSAKHRHVNDENYPVKDGLRITMSGSGRAGVIQGRLVDAATGLPPSELGNVRIVRRYSPKTHECSDDDGRFELPTEATLGNSYTVYVYVKRYAAAEARITAVAAGSKKLKTIKLTEGSLLRGKLVDADTGEPIEGASLLYGIADNAHYFQWSSFDQYADGYHSFDFVQRDKSNRRGGFWFAEPPADARGIIVIRADGYQRLMLRPAGRQVDKATGEVVIRLPKESALTGIVTKDGKKLANVSVSVSARDTDNFNNMFERVRTDAEGRFKYGRLGPGSYTLSGGPYSRAVSIAEGQTKTVNLGEDLGPIRIHGRVAPGMSISLSPTFDWEYRIFQAVGSPDGQYEISGLKPGRYRVSLWMAYTTGYFDSTAYEIDVHHDGEQMDLSAMRAAGPSDDGSK